MAKKKKDKSLKIGALWIALLLIGGYVGEEIWNSNISTIGIVLSEIIIFAFMIGGGVLGTKWLEDRD